MNDMEVYDTELSDEEIEYLLEVSKRRKRKRILIFFGLGLFIALFLAFSITAYFYNPSNPGDADIVEQYPFD